MNIDQATHKELVMFRDAVGEVHTSLAKIHFLGNRLFGDEFERFLREKTSLLGQIHKAVKDTESGNED